MAHMNTTTAIVHLTNTSGARTSLPPPAKNVVIRTSAATIVDWSPLCTGFESDDSAESKDESYEAFFSTYRQPPCYLNSGRVDALPILYEAPEDDDEPTVFRTPPVSSPLKNQFRHTPIAQYLKEKIALRRANGGGFGQPNAVHQSYLHQWRQEDARKMRTIRAVAANQSDEVVKRNEQVAANTVVTPKKGTRNDSPPMPRRSPWRRALAHGKLSGSRHGLELEKHDAAGSPPSPGKYLSFVRRLGNSPEGKNTGTANDRQSKVSPTGVGRNSSPRAGGHRLSLPNIQELMGKRRAKKAAEQDKGPEETTDHEVADTSQQPEDDHKAFI
ncbi:hypothetical protein FN846DRAFT_992396 [Sphaerosporella brunnea]|uniref:Uncharacterized protein n=1 Tax=Sphaerosporella brunnea TaxID=1250544 RepID=A0A5J5EN86_9PEZI|nr:hypothetical protein FN846DRAFT_992396 [Sphaerosporella brunnea]